MSTHGLPNISMGLVPGQRKAQARSNEVDATRSGLIWPVVRRERLGSPILWNVTPTTLLSVPSSCW